MMDISRLVLADLRHLSSILPAEIEKRLVLERERVIEELAALARARGFTLEELVRSLHAKNCGEHVVAQRRPARTKYQHPLDGGLTWSGRGKQPKWIASWQAQGRKIEELVVQD